MPAAEIKCWGSFDPMQIPGVNYALSCGISWHGLDCMVAPRAWGLGFRVEGGG